MNYKVTTIIVFILAAIGFAIFKNAPIQTITLPTPTPDAKVSPIVISPKHDDTISSPITIAGITPPGWMFEGVFPIKLLDENRKLIASTLGKEKIPGSWQSGNPVEFTASLNFTTTSDLGYIVLENDNPSGDPQKSKTFEIRVYFKKK